MEDRDFVKWEIQMGDMSTQGEITFEKKASPAKTNPRQGKVAELMQQLGAALVSIGARWENERQAEKKEE